MSPIVRAPKQSGELVTVVDTTHPDMEYLGLSLLTLEEVGQEFTLQTDEQEYGIDILSGICAVEVRAPSATISLPEVGNRVHPFAGSPSMLYLPRGSDARFSCHRSPLEAVLVSAHCRKDTHPAYIPADQAPFESFGQDNWVRTVFPSIGMQIDADRIVMGETHTPSGGWSSYPPHKHDDPSQGEEPSEELYHYLIDPPFGFALQSVWSSPQSQGELLDEAHRLQHGDTVLIPRGYHPVVVAPGFRMITVWAYAGEQRTWGAWRADARYESVLMPDKSSE